NSFYNGVTAVGFGPLHRLAVKSNATVWASGANFVGELGDGTTTESPTPVQVRGPGGTGFLTGVTKVAVGAFHSLALKADGTLWAWGSNGSGSLGNGTNTDSTTPVQVRGPGGSGFLAGVIAIA